MYLILSGCPVSGRCHDGSQVRVRRNAATDIVENKVNLLTLPPCTRTIGLGALGRAVSELRTVRWLATVPVTYWGDLDVEGFEILSSLRVEFPHAQSVLMDCETLARYQSLSIAGTGRRPSQPPHLTASESRAFDRCVQGNMRLEQERIPLAGSAQFISPVESRQVPSRTVPDPQGTAGGRSV